MEKNATKNDWEITPMPEENAVFQLSRKFTGEEMAVLLRGNIPQEMEDKWFWYCEDGKLYAHRSWTGFCIYIVEFNNETGVHTVTVNRDMEQYRCRNVQEDARILDDLLNWWSQPEYDYYGEWLTETVDALKRK